MTLVKPKLYHKKNSMLLAQRIRRHSLLMASQARTSHVASALSVADILAVLYTDILCFDPSTPNKPERSRLILSKGHAGTALYATLAECGFFPIEWLEQYGQDGAPFSGHVSSLSLPGIEFSTGSLGHGLSVAAGMALAAKLCNKSFRTFVIIGDGECDEGAVWEAALFAAHHDLNNLTVIIDANGGQGFGDTSAVLNLEPLEEKWRSFGWHAVTLDGHHHAVLATTLSQSHITPHCVIARTVKGKGVSFMENQLLWHYRDPQGEQLSQALAEIDSLQVIPDGDNHNA